MWNMGNSQTFHKRTRNNQSMNVCNGLGSVKGPGYVEYVEYVEYMEYMEYVEYVEYTS